MGNNNSIKDELNSGTLVFETFRTLKWLERIWKVFCFRFEYKYYKFDTNKYMITWDEFEGIFLDEFIVDKESDKIDLNHWIIYHVFKKIFEYDNNEIRVYRVYLMFFPYCLHINGSEGMNFIDLLFEKIIYNLEVEMGHSLIDIQPVEKEDSGEEDNDDDYFGISDKIITNENSVRDSEDSFSQVSEARDRYDDNINFNKGDEISKRRKAVNNDFLSNRDNQDISSRPLNTNKSNRFISNNKLPNIREDNKEAEIDINRFNCPMMERELIQKFHYQFVNTKQLGYIRIISFDLFNQIMYVYFYNNIVLFLKAFKDILNELEEESYDDEGFVYKIKKIKNTTKNIKMEAMTDLKINKFLQNSYNQLFNVRDNLSRSGNNVSLTFDDIYVYMKKNFYFFNTVELYNQFIFQSTD